MALFTHKKENKLNKILTPKAAINIIDSNTTHLLELDTVIGSDLFSQDEYIKQYLLDSNLSLISKIKIGLRYYITAQPELILQLTVFKGYLEKVNPFLYWEVFGKYGKGSRKW